MHQYKQSIIAACLLFVFSLLIVRKFSENDFDAYHYIIHKQRLASAERERKVYGEHGESHANVAVVKGPMQRYAPLQMRDCTPTMPAHYAPCLALTLTNAVAGEELVYPAFTLSEPVFAASRTNDSARWWSMAEDLLADRAHRFKERLIYDEQHGQTIVCGTSSLASIGS